MKYAYIGIIILNIILNILNSKGNSNNAIIGYILQNINTFFEIYNNKIPNRVFPEMKMNFFYEIKILTDQFLKRKNF